MIIEMMYNIFSDKTLRSNFLYDHLFKIEQSLDEKIFLPFMRAVFDANIYEIRDGLKTGIILTSKKKGAEQRKGFYHDYTQLLSIIESSR